MRGPTHCGGAAVRLARMMSLATLVASILAACGGSVHHRPQHAAVVDNAPPAAAPIRRSPPAGTAALRLALLRGLAQAGPNSGALVYDLSDGMPLFALRSKIARPPASVEKLYTSVAVLNDLGPNTKLRTRVLGTGHLGPGGVWHGNLYLVGGGDPTFGDQTFNRTWEWGYGSTAAQLAGRLHAAGIRRVTGRVIGDGSLFDPRVGPPSTGFAPDIPDLGGQLSALTFDHGSTGNLSPPAFAARQLAQTMGTAHIQAIAYRFPGKAPAGARLLASVSSPPASVLVRLMDVPSDDFFAEMLTKQLGIRFAGAGTTKAGAGVITEAMAAYGIHPKVVDGSGLSRADSSSPLDVVRLLREVHGTATGQGLQDALPLVGVSGTTRTIAVQTAAQGHCIAKTGTLDGVTNLAGYCHAKGGQLLAFALFVDGPPNWSALVTEGQMIAAIARL